MDEPGSNAYSVQMWKRLKMDERTSEASRAARVAGMFSDISAPLVFFNAFLRITDFCHWDQSISFFNTDMNVSRIAMHSSQNYLVASDDTNIIRFVNLS